MREPGASSPLRLFLDAGVIVEGCFGPWGAAKGVLIVMTVRARYTVILADPIEREVQRAVARKVAALDPDAARAMAESVAGWLARVRIERCPWPPPEEMRTHAPGKLPVLRHVNDLPGVVAAIQAHPDWVISTNTRHWSDELASRTGLHIATPLGFLTQLAPMQE